ncbi:MAG: DUF1513 domain-containing protein, partial [Myxococcales bacterium]|nr:DUF1513 domain-containing protein [Myxococcales bacterium]
ERRRFAPYRGAPALHHGALVLRDPETLAEIQRVDCHGIGPHEIDLLEDGRHVAVANYGNTELPGKREGYAIVETSLTVVELATGKLVHKAIPEPREGADWQVRHLAAQRLDRMLAILVHNVPTDTMPDFFAALPGVYEPDLTSDPGLGYFPAPLLRVDARAGRTREVWPAERGALRQGQSIVYDAPRDQWIASFASAHRIVVVSGATGEVTRVIATDALGLRYPRGLDLHPDGRHYVVAGSWQDLLLFRLDDHRPVPERSHHTVFFDHSHLTAYAPV